MPLIPKSSAVTNKIDIKSLEKNYIELGWEILYHKCLYYEFAGYEDYDFLRISDDEFDALEKQYNKICKLLNKTPTATKVGFDPRSGSGSLVITQVLLKHHYRTHINKNAAKPKKKKT
jgi:hypothetical protein